VKKALTGALGKGEKAVAGVEKKAAPDSNKKP
jgi:hypothetical protein